MPLLYRGWEYAAPVATFPELDDRLRSLRESLADRERAWDALADARGAHRTARVAAGKSRIVLRRARERMLKGRSLVSRLFSWGEASDPLLLHQRYESALGDHRRDVTQRDGLAREEAAALSLHATFDGVQALYESALDAKERQVAARSEGLAARLAHLRRTHRRIDAMQKRVRQALTAGAGVLTAYDRILRSLRWAGTLDPQNAFHYVSGSVRSAQSQAIRLNRVHADYVVALGDLGLGLRDAVDVRASIAETMWTMAEGSEFDVAIFGSSLLDSVATADRDEKQLNSRRRAAARRLLPPIARAAREVDRMQTRLETKCNRLDAHEARVLEARRKILEETP